MVSGLHQLRLRAIALAADAVREIAGTELNRFKKGTGPSSLGIERSLFQERKIPVTISAQLFLNE
jgi:hypothetical protein